MNFKRESFAKIPAPLAGLGLGVSCLGIVILNFVITNSDVFS